MGLDLHTFETVASLNSKALHVITLWMAASIQGAHLVGLGVFPSHALNIVALHVLIPSKEESKHLFCFEDSVNYPKKLELEGNDPRACVLM